MASSPLTLAALATSAVPGLIVHGTREHVSDGAGEYSSAVLVCEEEELIVRVPRTQAAEVRQSAELLALAALTAGARARLPFNISEPRGMTRAGDTRAVVSTFLRGQRIEADVLDPDALLLDSLAHTLAAIHELPHTIAHQHGLTVRTSDEVRLAMVRLVERAEATRLLPNTVQTRWTGILRTAELWDFAPTLVHGSLGIDQLLVDDDTIIGVLGWDELSVGDPAADFAWLLGSGGMVLDQVLHRYVDLRGLGAAEHMRTRVIFFHELEVAKWLLHGVEQHDSSIIDDAVRMFDKLVDRLDRRPASSLAEPSLTTDQVSRLLDDVPDVAPGLSDTAAYEALDEDRMFHIDTDFLDPLPDEDTDPDGSGSHDSTNNETERIDVEDSHSLGAQDSTASTEEQHTESIDPLNRETEPIDPTLLPPKRPE